MWRFFGACDTTRILTLYFSESVSPSSLVIDGLTLQNRNRQPTEGIALTSATTSSSEGTVIEILVSNEDINRLKQNENLYTSEENSYLAIASYAITDTAGNHVVTVAPSNALQVSDFNNDTRPPVLMSFMVDLDSIGRSSLAFLRLSMHPLSIPLDWPCTMLQLHLFSLSPIASLRVWVVQLFKWVFLMKISMR